MNCIAKINGTRALEVHEVVNHPLQQTKKRTLGMLHLFKYRSVRNSILIAASLYFFVQMQYYGSVLTQQFLEVDLYQQVIYGALIDTAANLFATF